ncbi:MAG: hypothetical protein M1836_001686 [Candelina mexicana]|nr:MAG: hypothetical protein M1836_001686 [Candelina mexicana]
MPVIQPSAFKPPAHHYVSDSELYVVDASTPIKDIAANVATQSYNSGRSARAYLNGWRVDFVPDEIPRRVAARIVETITLLLIYYSAKAHSDQSSTKTQEMTRGPDCSSDHLEPCDAQDAIETRTSEFGRTQASFLDLPPTARERIYQYYIHLQRSPLSHTTTPSKNYINAMAVPLLLTCKPIYVELNPLVWGIANTFVFEASEDLKMFLDAAAASPPLHLDPRVHSLAERGYLKEHKVTCKCFANLQEPRDFHLSRKALRRVVLRVGNGNPRLTKIQVLSSEDHKSSLGDAHVVDIGILMKLPRSKAKARAETISGWSDLLLRLITHHSVDHLKIILEDGYKAPFFEGRNSVSLAIQKNKSQVKDSLKRLEFIDVSKRHLYIAAEMKSCVQRRT